ncbi:hypothetical protein [Natronoarchaeum rubrum]|uniref:hypothetical protein n=1 Tax=Natronoarchaeum rubrum TaxID=755311 RepID=UPI0021123992|nr:hypothetical protein [Natronoarchaeum rubrum]
MTTVSANATKTTATPERAERDPRVKSRPPLPPIEDVRDDLLAGGHLWLQEYVDGGSFRFQLRADGAIRFGDRENEFEPGDPPLPYRRALAHVRENLDRRALREAVADVGAVTFFGVATHHRSIDYDWARTPPVLGTDVWSATEERFLPPDRVEQTFRRLGLDPINAVRKELRAQDFDPDAYEFPASNWYDGPVAGVVVRSKTGGAAQLLAPEFERGSGRNDAPAPDAVDPADALVEHHATDRRLEGLVGTLEAQERGVTADALTERALDAVAREAPAERFGDGGVDEGALRSALAPRVREFLDTRSWE